MAILAIMALLFSATSTAWAGATLGESGATITRDDTGKGNGNPGNNNPGQNNTNNPGNEGESNGGPGREGATGAGGNSNGGNGNPGNNNPGKNNTNNPGSEGASNGGLGNESSSSSSAARTSSANGASDKASGKPENPGGPNGDDEDGDKGKPEGAGGSGGAAGAGGAGGSGGGGNSGGKPENDMSGKSSGPAANSPSGNNGTFKLHRGAPIDHGSQNKNHQPGGVEIRSNMPHLGCTFHIYAYHFDASSTFDFWVEMWSPTGERGVRVYDRAQYEASHPGGPQTMSGQGDWVSFTISQSEFRNDTSTAVNRHGFHYKFYFLGDDEKHPKQKVVWIEPCEQTPPPDDEEESQEATVCVEIGNSGKYTEKTFKLPEQQEQMDREKVADELCDEDEEGEEQSDEATVCVELGNSGKYTEKTFKLPQQQEQMDREKVADALCDEDEGDQEGDEDTKWICDDGEMKEVDEDDTRPLDDGTCDDDDTDADDTKWICEDGEMKEVSESDSRPDDDGTCDDDSDNETGGVSTRETHECVGNMLVVKKYRNNVLVDTDTVANAACGVVAGIQTPPDGNASVPVIVEVVRNVVAGVQGLPSTATRLMDRAASDKTALGLAGMAILAAGLLLLRRRTARLPY